MLDRTASGDSWDSTIKMGGQNGQNMTAWTGSMGRGPEKQPGQGIWDRTAGAGQSGLTRWRRQSRYFQPEQELRIEGQEHVCTVRGVRIARDNTVLLGQDKQDRRWDNSVWTSRPGSSAWTGQRRQDGQNTTGRQHSWGRTTGAGRLGQGRSAQSDQPRQDRQDKTDKPHSTAQLKFNKLTANNSYYHNYYQAYSIRMWTKLGILPIRSGYHDKRKDPEPNP